MILLELLTVGVGAGIAKGALKLWLQDASLAAEAGTNIVDLLSGKTKDLFARRSANRQLEKIGERVAAGLLPLFEAEGERLEENSLASVAIAAGETVQKTPLTAQLLISRDLDPVQLERLFLDSSPDVTALFSEAETQLYERTIREASQYIVDLASTFPRFTEATLTEVLRRETALLDRANQLIDEVQRIRLAVDVEFARAAQFESEYRRAVTRRLDRIELFGVDASASSRRYKLSVGYVSLSVNALKEGEAITGRLSEDPSDVADIMPVSLLLSHHRRIFAIGSAGSGKTTLLQWIAVQAASNSFAGELSDWNDQVPFFVRLREFSEKELPKPENFVELIAPAIAGDMPPRWVHERLKTGRAILLIDGLDELPSARHHILEAWLTDLMASYPNLRYVLSSRPHATNLNWAPSHGFTNAVLKEMSINDIEAFVDHWHAAVAGEEHTESVKVQLEELRQNLRATIRTNRQIRKLAQTPLLCAMLCALHRDRVRQLPLDRVELYRACIDMFFRRDTERNIQLSDYPVLTSRHKLALLSDLAYWLVKNGWSEVEEFRVDSRLQSRLRNMGRKLIGVPASSVRKLFVERSGILREPTPGKIDFPHRTFQEYLAAQAALEEGDVGVLVTHAEDDQWREVVLLAAGLARPEEAAELVTELISRGDTEVKLRHQLYLLAISCSEMAVEMLPEVRSVAEMRLRRVVPPRSIADAEELAAVGSIVVPYLRRNPLLNVREASACIRTLALVGGDEALIALSTYLNDSRVGVQDALVQSAKHTDLPEEYGKVALVDCQFLKFNGRFSFELFRHLHNLESLYLELDMATHLDLSVLSSLVKLKELSLGWWFSNPWGNADLTPLSSLVNLEALDLMSSQAVKNVAPLAVLPRLKYLNLMHSGVEDLYQLRDFPALEVVGVNSDKPLPDFFRQRRIKVIDTFFRARTPPLFPTHLLSHARVR